MQNLSFESRGCTSTPHPPLSLSRPQPILSGSVAVPAVFLPPPPRIFVLAGAAPLAASFLRLQHPRTAPVPFPGPLT
jgi:hypothetical protein